jgi:hypothetical protein
MLYFADSLKLLYPKFHNSLIAILSENEIEFDIISKTKDV